MVIRLILSAYPCILIPLIGSRLDNIEGDLGYTFDKTTDGFLIFQFYSLIQKNWHFLELKKSIKYYSISMKLRQNIS